MRRAEVPPVKQPQWGLCSDKNMQGDSKQVWCFEKKKKKADRHHWEKESEWDRNKIYLLEIVHSGTPYILEPRPPLIVCPNWAVLGAI